MREREREGEREVEDGGSGEGELDRHRTVATSLPLSPPQLCVFYNPFS